MAFKSALVAGLVLSAEAVSAASMGYACLGHDGRLKLLVARPPLCRAGETRIVWKVREDGSREAPVAAAARAIPADARRGVSTNEMAAILSILLLPHTRSGLSRW